MSHQALRRSSRPAATPTALATSLDDPGEDTIEDRGVAVHSTDVPVWARNRVQRVHGRKCAACRRAVYRASRGPAPRHCVACEVRVRRLRQLRAYLRSAERLATELGRPAIAAIARDAAIVLDAGVDP